MSEQAVFIIINIYFSNDELKSENNHLAWLKPVIRRVTIRISNKQGINMKLGMRKRSFSKSFKARTLGKYKRRAKKAINPFYGKSGINLYKNPKKYFYNKAYKNLTVGMPFTGLASDGKGKKKKKVTTSGGVNNTNYYEENVMNKDENKKQKFTENPIGWFKGLSTGWKILVVILIISLVGSVPYVLSGQYEKDEEARKQEIEKQESAYNDAYKKCVVQEVKDIYNTYNTSNSYPIRLKRETAIGTARSSCKYTYEYQRDKLVEDMNIDWAEGKVREDELLGHTLQWWYENYDNIDKLYDDALEQAKNTPN